MGEIPRILRVMVGLAIRVLIFLLSVTRDDCNSGLGRQAHGRINALTQWEVEQDPRVITGTLLVFGN